MLAIRVVVGRIEHAAWRAIEPRLRGATIESGTDIAHCSESLPACQAVVFLGPVELDERVVMRFLQAGKHVLLAGEPCLSWASLESLSTAARQSNVQLALVNPDRYLPSRRLIKQHLGPKLGNAELVRSHRWEPPNGDHLSEPWGLPNPLVRDLEQVLWLTGQSPRMVYAVESVAPPGSTVAGRFVQVHLGFAQSMALVDYDHRLPPGADYRALSVIGTHGAAYADDHQNMQLLLQGGHQQAVRTEEGPGAQAAMVQEFVDAIAAGRDLSETMTPWREVHAVAEAVKKSLTSRAAITLEGR